MIPEIIKSELFNIHHRAGDAALDYICEKLGEFGFVVSDLKDLDLIIRITFERASDSGELRIDRMNQLFEICTIIDEETIFPVSGDWELIVNYLSVVSRSEVLDHD